MFVVLGTVMYLTRKINWYAISSSAQVEDWKGKP
jgi:inner membrane protein involved in colicin E2 resistance